MTARIEKVTSLAECDTARAIAATVWGADSACSTPQMSVHAKYGGVVLLAYVDEQPVGFLFSFPALYRGEWVLWSHETAVLPEYLHQGIGTRLKFAQREAAKELGYKTIGWTYDPLVSRNAHFNLNKLGARIVEYKVNAYGADEDDLVNRGIETDRFIAVWDVQEESDRGQPIGTHGNAHEVVLAVLEDGQPALHRFGHDDSAPGDFGHPGSSGHRGHPGIELITQIPLASPNTHNLRVSWREAFRAAALGLVEQGFVPVAFRRGNHGEYVWHKSLSER